METEGVVSPDWVTVAEAVGQTGARERTLYRAVKNGRLPSQIAESGVTLVDLAAARALAAAATLPPKPAIPMVAAAQSPVAGGGRQRAELDGDLAARLFERMQEGARPVDLVQEFRVSPEKVRALAREFRALKAEEERAPSSASVADKWQQLSDRLDAVSIRQGSIEQFGEYVEGINARVTAVEAQVEEIFGSLRMLTGRFLNLAAQSDSTASKISQSELRASMAIQRVDELMPLLRGVVGSIDQLRRSIPLQAKIAALEMIHDPNSSAR
jgi:hypothetical protein